MKHVRMLEEACDTSGREIGFPRSWRMVRHDPHGHSGESDPPGTPGVRALGAMAAAARRAREVQEGGPPTRAVEIPFDDDLPPSVPGTRITPPWRPPAGAAHSRSPCGSLPPWSWWRPAPWPSHSERAEPAVDRHNAPATSAHERRPDHPARRVRRQRRWPVEISWRSRVPPRRPPPRRRPMRAALP